MMAGFVRDLRTRRSTGGLFQRIFTRRSKRDQHDDRRSVKELSAATVPGSSRMAEARGAGSGGGSGGDWPSPTPADGYDPGPSYDERAPDLISTEPKRKRFRALRVVRKIFRRKAKNVFKDDDSDGPAVKSRSTSELTVADDPEVRDSGSISSTAYSSGLSLSHDSIFAPDSGSPEPPEQEGRAAAASGFGHPVRQFPSAKEMQEELKRRLGQRQQANERSDNDQDSDDYDPGLPSSPCTSPTVDEVPRRLPGRSATNFSSVSSLMSMGSSGSGGEDAYIGQDASNDELSVGATKLLNNQAARHKISVKPRRNHAVPRSRQIHQVPHPSSLATTPEDVEVPPVSPTGPAKPSSKIPPLSPTDTKCYSSPTQRSTSLNKQRPADVPVQLHRTLSMGEKAASAVVVPSENAPSSLVITSVATKTIDSSGSSSSKSNAATRKLQHEIKIFTKQQDKITTSATEPRPPLRSPSANDSPKSPVKSRPTSPNRDQREEQERSPSPESGCFPKRKSSSGKGGSTADSNSVGLFRRLTTSMKNGNDGKRKSSAESANTASDESNEAPPLPARSSIKIERPSATSGDVGRPEISSLPMVAARSTTEVVPPRPTQAKPSEALSSIVSKQQDTTVGVVTSGAVARRSNSTRIMTNTIARLSQNFESSAFSLPSSESAPVDGAAQEAHDGTAVLVVAPERRDVDTNLDAIMIIEAQETGPPSVSPTVDRSLIWGRTASVPSAFSKMEGRGAGRPQFETVSGLRDAPALPPRSPSRSPPGTPPYSLTPKSSSVQEKNIAVEGAVDRKYKKTSLPSVSRQPSTSDKRKPIEQQLSKEEMNSLEYEHSEFQSPSAISRESLTSTGIHFTITSGKDPNVWAQLSSSQTIPPEPVLPSITRSSVGPNVYSPPHVRPAADAPCSMSMIEREPPSRNSLRESRPVDVGVSRNRPSVEVTFPPTSLPSTNMFPQSVRVDVDYQRPSPSVVTLRGLRPVSDDDRLLSDKISPVNKENLIVIETTPETLVESPAPPLPPKGEAPIGGFALRPVPQRNRPVVQGDETSELEKLFKRRSIHMKPADAEAVSAAAEEHLKAEEAVERKVAPSPVVSRPEQSKEIEAAATSDVKIKENPVVAESSVRKRSMQTSGSGTSTESSATSSMLRPMEIKEIGDSRPVTLPIIPNSHSQVTSSKVASSSTTSSQILTTSDQKLAMQGVVENKITDSTQPGSPSVFGVKSEPLAGIFGPRKVSVRQINPPVAEIDIVSLPPVETLPSPVSEVSSKSIASGAVGRSNGEQVQPRRSNIPVPVDRKVSSRKESVSGGVNGAVRASFCQEEANIVILDSPDKEKPAILTTVEAPVKVLSPPSPTVATTIPTVLVTASRKSSMVSANGVAPSKEAVLPTRGQQIALGLKQDSINNIRRKLSESARPTSSIVISSNPLSEAAADTTTTVVTATNDIDVKKGVATSLDIVKDVVTRPISSLSRSSSVSFGSRDSVAARLTSIEAVQLTTPKLVEVVPLLPLKTVEVVINQSSNGATGDCSKSSIQSTPPCEADVKSLSSPPVDKLENLPDWHKKIVAQKRRDRLQTTVPTIPQAELIIDPKIKPGNKRSSKVLDIVSNFQKLQVS